MSFVGRFVVALAAVLLLEGTLLSRMAIGGIRPDLGLALVVYAGLAGGGRGGVLVGFLLGLLRGCLDPTWLGLEALLLSLVGFAAGLTSPIVNREHPLVQAVILVLLLLAHDLVRAAVIVGGAPGRVLLAWLSVSPATALYTALVAPLLAMLSPRLVGGRRRRAVS